MFGVSRTSFSNAGDAAAVYETALQRVVLGCDLLLQAAYFAARRLTRCDHAVHFSCYKCKVVPMAVLHVYPPQSLSRKVSCQALWHMTRPHSCQWACLKGSFRRLVASLITFL